MRISNWSPPIPYDHSLTWIVAEIFVELSVLTFLILPLKKFYLLPKKKTSLATFVKHPFVLLFASVNMFCGHFLKNRIRHWMTTIHLSFHVSHVFTWEGARDLRIYVRWESKLLEFLYICGSVYMWLWWLCS